MIEKKVCITQRTISFQCADCSDKTRVAPSSAFDRKRGRDLGAARSHLKRGCCATQFPAPARHWPRGRAPRRRRRPRAESTAYAPCDTTPVVYTPWHAFVITTPLSSRNHASEKRPPERCDTSREVLPRPPPPKKTLPTWPKLDGCSRALIDPVFTSHSFRFYRPI